MAFIDNSYTTQAPLSLYLLIVKHFYVFQRCNNPIRIRKKILKFNSYNSRLNCKENLYNITDSVLKKSNIIS